MYASFYESAPQMFKTNKPGDQSSTVGVEVVVNPSAAVSRVSLTGPFEVLDEPRATVRWLAEERRVHEARFLQDWTGKFVHLSAELRERKELDGLVKEMLLRHLLEAAASASPFLERELASALKLLRDRQGIQDAWYESRPQQASFEPEIEADVISELARVYQIRNRYWDRVAASTDRQYRWIGFLFGMPENSNTLIFCGRRPDDAGTLYVVRPTTAEDGRSKLVEIGRCVEGEPELSTRARRLPPGLPVFFFPDVSGESSEDA